MAKPKRPRDRALDADQRGAFEILARLALVFAHMHDAVIITDLAGRIVDWNPAAEEVFGYTRAEMLGHSVARLYVTDAPEQLEQALVDAMEAHGRWRGELRFSRKDGIQGLCETTVVPLRDAEGKRVATIGVNRDITEQRRMQTALAETHSMMAAVVHGTPDAIFLKDLQGCYVMVNAAGSRMLRRPVEAIIGRDDREFFEPADAAEIMAVDRRVMQSGEPHAFEETVSFAGSPRRLSTTKAPWRDARNRIVGLIGIARDVTERWASEESVRRHRDELAHVLRVRTIDEMAAGLGHEINQPLGAIANYAEGCVRRLRAVNGDAEVIAAAEEIGALALRAGQIIRRLGEFVRKQPSRRETVELDSVVRAAARLIEREAHEEGVALELSLVTPLPVRVDPVQMEQVVLNLLLNGIEAMRNGDEPGKTLSIRIRQTEPRFAQVEISDTGPGVAPEHVTEIFKPFFTTKPNGLGMGLAISRSIVEAHGGNLFVEARRDGGATFVVRLPLAAAEPATVV